MKTNNSKGQLTFQIDIDKQQKNGFPIPCDFFTTGKLGVIYPTQALEVSYGDKIRNTSSVALQMNPLAVPIMANMFIKQEHYYTPYNDVWENWDNFISGGEDLTFTTPPPTFTMQRLMTMLTSLFSPDLDYKVLTFDASTTTNFHGVFHAGTYCYLKLPDHGTISVAISQHAAPFFGTYGMTDIYSHFVFEAVRQIEDYFDSLRNEIDIWYNSFPTPIGNRCNLKFLKLAVPEGSMPAGNYVLVGATNDGSFTDSNNVKYNAFEPDYVDEEKQIFSNSLVHYVSTEYPDSVELVNSFLFTEYGRNYFNLYYKMYKPFIGVGSYIDCLNINRLTDTDFYYLYYAGFIEAKENESDFTFSTELLSDKPDSALALRVQYLIWYNNYRDQLLETQAFKPSRTDTITDVELIVLTIPRVRCWEKDSYTTALDNPATADAFVPAPYALYGNLYTQDVVGAASAEVKRNNLDIYKIQLNGGDVLRIPTGFISGLSPDSADEYTSGTGFSLHMLDAVKRAQKFFRKALFYGNRIQDFIFTTWGVSHLDARLRLPELLGTSSDMVNIQTLVNNTTTEVSDAGERAGLANGFDNGNYFERYCEETGLIMSFLTIMPQPTYGYGSDRKYSRLDRFDFPMPEFATLGMDAVYDSELTCVPVKVWNASIPSKMSAMPLVFGYQGRYYDFKFRQSTEHGELLTTQDMYTFGRRWNMYDPSGRPRLNYEFVHCFPPLDMFVMEDRTEDYWRADVHHNTTAELTLPYHSIYM